MTVRRGILILLTLAALCVAVCGVASFWRPLDVVLSRTGTRVVRVSFAHGFWHLAGAFSGDPPTAADTMGEVEFGFDEHGQRKGIAFIGPGVFSARVANALNPSHVLRWRVIRAWTASLTGVASLDWPDPRVVRVRFTKNANEGVAFRLYDGAIAFWIPTVLLGAWPVIALVRGPLRRRRRRKRGLCMTCGYNAAGNTSDVCPECGNPVAKPTQNVGI